MRIERLDKRAWQRLKTIRLRALLDAPDAFGTTHEEAKTWPDEVWARQAADLPTFIANAGTADVGIVRVSRNGHAPEDAELISMWVADTERGRGVAEALVGAVVTWARQAGMRRILLSVADSNAPAIALYDRLGFRPTGVTGAYPAPREHITEHERAYRL